MSQKRRATDSPTADRPTPSKRPLVINSKGQPRFKGCSTSRAYEVISKLGEGTFGIVHKAKSRSTGRMVAMKHFTVTNEKEGFPITALREIKYLKMLKHPNVIQLIDMAIERPTVGKEGNRRGAIMMVTPYMHHDLSGLLENPDVTLTEPQIKCYMLQLLQGTKYLHQSKILHRDIKAANLLINNKGILQIADFGLARRYDEPPPTPGSGGGVARRQYTGNVVTRWYRAPELCLGERNYTPSVDIWGVGCVFAEMYKGKPILPGNSDLNQIQLIFQLCGSPNDRNMPNWENLPEYSSVIKSFGRYPRTLEGQYSSLGSAGVALLAEFLRLDPRTRINAIDALEHEFFRADPLPANPADLPRFEDSHELDRRKQRGQKPPAPAGGTVGVGTNVNGDWGARAGEMPPYVNGGSRRQPPQAPPPNHRAPWAKDGRPLPPPPPTSQAPTELSTIPPPPRGLPPKPPVDTYIPPYSKAPRQQPPMRDDGHRGRDRDRDRGERDRFRERDPYIERPPPRERDHDRRDRERDKERERREQWRR